MLFNSNTFFVLNKGRKSESGFQGKNIWCSGYGRSIHTDNICSNPQITFVPTKPAQKQKKIFLFGKEYQPYTHSFLCCGLTEAQRRFFAQLPKVKVSFWPKVCALILLISYLIILPTEFGESVQNELSLVRVKLEDKLKEPLVFSVKAS